LYTPSAGQDPNQVSRQKLAIKAQKIRRVTGEKLNPLKISDLEFWLNRKRTRTARTKPKTPPNLLGIERKIAYANKKYHSG
jgi:hypothetical protein